MSFCAVILIITIYGLGLSKFLQTGIHNTFPLAISLFILILYFTGIADRLLWGFHIILLFLLPVFLYIRKTIKKLITEYVTKEYYIFIALTFLCFVFMKERLFLYSDEFSHWGLVTKNIWYSNRILTEESTVLFPNYPPGMALWQWFILRISGNWTEGSMYWSYMLFAWSWLLPVVGKQKDRGWGETIFLFILWINVPCVFFDYYLVSIMIDPAIALLFSQILYRIWNRGERSEPVEDISLCVSAWLLVLLKDAGFIFVIFGLLLVICKMISDKGKSYSRGFLVLYTISAVILKLTWENYWRKRGESEIRLNGSAISIDMNWVLHIAENFWKKMQEGFFQLGIFKINYLVLLLVFLVLMALFALLQEKGKRRQAIWWGISQQGILLFYIAALLYLYVVSFSESEALAIVGFKRYSSVATAPVLLFYLYSIADAIDKKTFRFKGIYVTAVIAVLLPSITERMKALDPHIYLSWRGMYERLESFSPDKDERIWVIDQHSNTGVTYYLANYILTPAHVQEHYLGSLRDGLQYTFSLGKAWEGELPARNYDIDAQTWAEMLVDGGYTFVYVHLTDDVFIKDFGCLFQDEIQRRTFYHVRIKEERLFLEMADGEHCGKKDMAE